YTPEGEQLSGQPWQAYPRPQLQRDSFICLNGEWDFAITSSDSFPEQYDRRIIVPFAPESLLSGIHEVPERGSYLYYRTTFPRPECGDGMRVILHFGAADQYALVRLGGVELGYHSGGYEPFSFDITEQLADENILEVRCFDPIDHTLPYGKQTWNRGGMWYTPVSGIWQTVWMECVPEQHIEALYITTDAAGVTIDTGDDALEGDIVIDAPDGAISARLCGGRAQIDIPRPRLWSPEEPYLYRFTVTTAYDRVSSYFAMRTLEIKQSDGIARLCLNGKPYFFHGLLDQGYWSDGLFTPATPEGFERDILAMKALGFNTLRKHIKVEPEQFYYDCDRLGMIVFQDMVNNGDYSFLRDTALPTIGIQRSRDRRRNRGKAARGAFIDAMEQTVTRLKNHPCICCWTIFNEGWGQFCSSDMYAILHKLDDSRFIDTTSGWFRCGTTDVDSRHVYFKPFRLPKQSGKPIVLSEFGGYSYKPEGHVFNISQTYGYRFFRERGAFEDALEALYREQIIPAAREGLCAAIYTQVSDVEDETNGLLSYDRRIVKVDTERMTAIARELVL
ncbi:MAG: glycoside hydrolase family 2, partial [Clostridia bacterium]|nr:glycoside hydrolase family 2 [Clostridia bacterium]